MLDETCFRIKVRMRSEPHYLIEGHEEKFWKFHQYLQEKNLQSVGLQRGTDQSGMGEGFEQILRRILDTLSEKKRNKGFGE